MLKNPASKNLDSSLGDKAAKVVLKNGPIRTRLSLNFTVGLIKKTISAVNLDSDSNEQSIWRKIVGSSVISLRR